MGRLRPFLWLLGLAVSMLATLPALAETKLQALLPLGRVAYQTNEQIDLTVVRTAEEPMPAGDLTLTATGADASKVTLVFPLEAATASASEHLHLNGWLLRPGNYTVDIAYNGATAQTKFELYTHLRKSPFKILDWGANVKGADTPILGEDSMGYNLLYAHYGGFDHDFNIRGGLDYMPCCTMSGGHQMDLRLECDWSDPYVLGGGEARVARAALRDRTLPNCLGIHFYDEPGLSWMTHPKTGKGTPYNLPPQDRSYKAAYGTEAPQYCDLNSKDPASVKRWLDEARWREGFMDAAWQFAKFGVSQVKPDFLSITQSVYGWTAYSDGYYFNVVRSLPIVSGHGGYDDWGLTYLNTIWFSDFGARIRDTEKPYWYLPSWGNLPSDRMRMEQYLSFMSNLQGMGTHPGTTMQNPAGLPNTADGVVESNKVMTRLGTIFTTMPATQPEAAVLFSLSNAENQPEEFQNSVFGGGGGGHLSQKNFACFIAGKLMHIPLTLAVEEDLLDGSAVTRYKALILPGVSYLEPNVLRALEAYIAAGGTVLLTDDSTVTVKGAQKLGMAMDKAYMAKFAEFGKKANNTADWMRMAEPVAKALLPKLAAAGVKPVLDCNVPTVFATRQAAGDIEYLFAVNATPDPTDEKAMNAIKAVTATITLPNDGRPIYDAVRGGAVSELKGGTKGTFRFGAGGMRVFARTARPIGGMILAPLAVHTDYTQAKEPVTLQTTATLVDEKNLPLYGSAPLEITLTDPLGAVRYDLYRATEQGNCKIVLPLAVNDPAGKWTLTVTELLSGKAGTATVTYQPPAQCGALGGATWRAVVLGDDRQHIASFFRTYHQVTLIKGTSDFDTAAVDRIMDALKPWGVRCNVVTAAEMNKPEPEGHDDWLDARMKDTYAAMKRNSTWAGPGGYDVPGPSILIGSPDDNPLIKGIGEMKVLPYQPVKGMMPGTGRGMLAWQRSAVRQGTESITVIAYDDAGMSEAVGSLFEAMACLDPLTPFKLPAVAGVTPATKETVLPKAAVAWQVSLPDRATGLEAAAGKLTVKTLDGSASTIDATGKVLSQTEAKDAAALHPFTSPAVPDAVKKSLLPYRVPKFVATGNGLTAVGYWGGGLQVFAADGTLKAQQQLSQDIAGLTWFDTRLIAALADGRVQALQVK